MSQSRIYLIICDHFHTQKELSVNKKCNKMKEMTIKPVPLIFGVLQPRYSVILSNCVPTASTKELPQ